MTLIINVHDHDGHDHGVRGRGFLQFVLKVHDDGANDHDLQIESLPLIPVLPIVRPTFSFC